MVIAAVAFLVVPHVVVEVAVDDDGADLEDDLGAVGGPPGSCNSESVLDDKSAGAFDHPGGNRPALLKRLVVAHVLAVVLQVGDGPVHVCEVEVAGAGIGAGLRGDGGEGGGDGLRRGRAGRGAAARRPTGRRRRGRRGGGRRRPCRGSRFTSVGKAQFMGVARGVLMHGDEAGDAAALQIFAAHRVAGALRRDHRHVEILARLDQVEVDVEAVGEQQGRALLEIGGKIIRVDLALQLVGRQHHDDVGPFGGLGDGP